MALIVLAVLVGGLVFLFGLVTRKRKIILVGSPAALLIVIWFVLASLRPNPQKEFDRLFGSSNRALASEIQTIKPTFMDGHFISFRMRPADFDARIGPQFSELQFASPPNLLLGQALPKGWPTAVEDSKSALHRQVDYHDVYLLYLPAEQTAYASVRYDQW
jgi:hypothetical protein